MKQLNLYWIGGGESSVPDGRTATPINDITLLQQCAGIANPTYTTLAEIFADPGVLQAIISSENAVNYLVRSTEFAKSEALVPTMTSNTTPSGECFGSSYRDSSYAYFKAFDNDSSTVWVPTSNATNNAIGYNFGTKTRVAKFRMVSRRTTVHTDTFTVQGSDDNFVSDIHDLVSFTQEANSQGGDYDEIKSISGNYKSYRVFCPTILYVANQYGVTTKEIQFYSENGFCDNATAMSYIGLNNYASNILLADSDWLEAICNSTYKESVLNVKVPTMTSNTTPSGTASQSSTYSDDVNTYGAWKAFDGVDSSAGTLKSNDAYGTSKYIGYAFTSSKKIKSIYIKGSSRLYTFKLVGRNSGSWEDIGSEQSFNGEGTYTYASNENTYSEYRILCLTGLANSPLGFNTIQFYGRTDV